MGGFRFALAKFILSISDESYEQLAEEAKDRGVKVQLLIRAVIIPEWARENLPHKPTTSNLPEHGKHPLESVAPATPMLVKPVSILSPAQKYEPVFIRTPRR